MLDGKSYLNMADLTYRVDNKGGSETFPIFSVLYYPIRDIKKRVSEVLYHGIRSPNGGNSKLEDYSVEGEGFYMLPDQILLKNKGDNLIDGQFTIHKNGSGVYGNLNINKIYNPLNPQITIRLFSPNAFVPYEHEIILFGKSGDRTVINTVDKDGSRWSICCGEMFSGKLE